MDVGDGSSRLHEKKKRKKRDNLKTRRKVRLVERSDLLKIGELTRNAVIRIHGRWRMKKKERRCRVSEGFVCLRVLVITFPSNFEMRPFIGFTLTLTLRLSWRLFGVWR